jgi:hypothetical protein
MIPRLAAFGAGSLIGALGTIVHSWFEYHEIYWWVVGLGALVFGLLAAIFGGKFFERVFLHWP